MRGADLLAFTSRETVELVMRKYPPEWASKARVLPHSFDPSLYARDARDGGGTRDGGGRGGDVETVVRYTGEFYGRRTPRPLVETLRAILSERPRLLEG